MTKFVTIQKNFSFESHTRVIVFRKGTVISGTEVFMFSKLLTKMTIIVAAIGQ